MKFARRVETVEETVTRLLRRERRDLAQQIRNAAPGRSIYGTSELDQAVNSFAESLAGYVEGDE